MQIKKSIFTSIVLLLTLFIVLGCQIDNPLEQTEALEIDQISQDYALQSWQEFTPTTTIYAKIPQEIYYMKYNPQRHEVEALTVYGNPLARGRMRFHLSGGSKYRVTFQVHALEFFQPEEGAWLKGPWGITKAKGNARGQDSTPVVTYEWDASKYNGKYLDFFVLGNGGEGILSNLHFYRR